MKKPVKELPAKDTTTPEERAEAKKIALQMLKEDLSPAAKQLLKDRNSSRVLH